MHLKCKKDVLSPNKIQQMFSILVHIFRKHPHNSQKQASPLLLYIFSRNIKRIKWISRLQNVDTDRVGGRHRHAVHRLPRQRRAAAPNGVAATATSHLHRTVRVRFGRRTLRWGLPGEIAPESATSPVQLKRPWRRDVDGDAARRLWRALREQTWLPALRVRWYSVPEGGGRWRSGLRERMQFLLYQLRLSDRRLSKVSWILTHKALKITYFSTHDVPKICLTLPLLLKFLQ